VAPLQAKRSTLRVPRKPPWSRGLHWRNRAARKTDDLPHSHVTTSPFPARAPSAFRHDAVFYAGARDFLPGVMPFVSAALEREEPLLVALVPARGDVLRGELGDASRRVEFVDMQSAGRNPARIIPVWRDFVTRHAGSGKTLNGVGEPIWTARSEPEIAECQRHESLLNLAFADAGAFALICPYDEAGLPAGVLSAARESHPHVVEGGRRCASAAYRGTEGIGAADRRPLSPPPADHHAHAFSAADVTSVRRETEDWANAHGLDASRSADLALAVHEAAANSIQHGGGRGVLRRWREDDALVCETADAGELSDPLAGRSLPVADSANGRGLWLINHLCDLVQVRSTASGTIVRLRQRVHRTP
jgi:anti-sigma regulatory factor (Ser/Thr protein kinase)